jgi:poly(A) polymerase
MTKAPPDRLAPQSWMRTPAIRRVVAALEEGGEEARLVGGCVRDALADRPIKDIDLATPLRPEAVIERLERAGIRVVPTGLSHGTVTAIVGPRKDAVEITTLRVDRETDGRRAIVDFTDDWTADAARRDFTINAISLSSDGRIHDPFGGAADLAQGRVRFVGEARQRIREDYLRLLRFFRFHAYYGRGAMDPEALAAARELAPGLARLSAERVREELLRLLAAPDPLVCLEAMREGGVLQVILPEAGSLQVLESLLRLEHRSGVAHDTILRLAALLVEESQAAESAGARLKLGTKDQRALSLIRSLAESLGAGEGADDVDGALHRHGPAAVERAQALAWARMEEPPAAAARADRLTHIRAWREIAFPLSGKDLLAAGVESGPEMGRLLRTLEEWWLEEDRRPDREACLERLHECVQPSGGSK